MPLRFLAPLAAALAAAACASAPAPMPAAPPPIAQPEEVPAAIDRGDGAALRAAAAHEDALIRAAALRGLGQLGDAGDTRLLRVALRDGDARVRAAAAWAAGRLAAADAVGGEGERQALAATVAGALATETEVDVRRALIRALGHLGTTPGPLLVAAVDEAALIRAEALYALGSLAAAAGALPAHERAAIASAAVGQARDPSADVRVAAAWLLAGLGDPATEEWLAALARDEEAQVRAFAARGLGAVASRPSLLEALLGDPAAGVRVEAAAALLEGLERAASAGVRGGADLAMEEAFANAIDRSVEALAHEVRDGAAVAVHALRRIAPAAPSARRRALARRALQEARFVQARASAVQADATLRTPAGDLPILLDRAAAPLGVARLRSIARHGGWRGARMEAPSTGRWIELAPTGGAEALLPVENAGAHWERGTVGLAPDGKLVIALGRSPELDGTFTPIGRIAAAIERLDALPPGGAIVDVVLH